MPANTTVTVPANTWTLITTTDVTAITFQNRCDGPLAVKATVGAVAPANRDGAVEYPPLFGEMNTDLSALFPGITGANRVYVLCVGGGEVMVSHA